MACPSPLFPCVSQVCQGMGLPGLVDTRGGRCVRCAASGTGYRVPYAPGFPGPRRPWKSPAWGAHTQCPWSLCGSGPHFSGAPSPRPRPPCGPSRGRRLTSSGRAPIPAKMEWRDRAERGSLQETCATDPLRSRSRRHRKGILARELGAPVPFIGAFPRGCTRHRVPPPAAGDTSRR